MPTDNFLHWRLNESKRFFNSFGLYFAVKKGTIDFSDKLIEKKLPLYLQSKIYMVILEKSPELLVKENFEENCINSSQDAISQLDGSCFLQSL